MPYKSFSFYFISSFCPSFFLSPFLSSFHQSFLCFLHSLPSSSLTFFLLFSFLFPLPFYILSFVLSFLLSCLPSYISSSPLSFLLPSFLPPLLSSLFRISTILTILYLQLYCLQFIQFPLHASFHSIPYYHSPIRFFHFAPFHSHKLCSSSHRCVLKSSTNSIILTSQLFILSKHLSI